MDPLRTVTISGVYPILAAVIESQRQSACLESEVDVGEGVDEPPAALQWLLMFSRLFHIALSPADCLLCGHGRGQADDRCRGRYRLAKELTHCWLAVTSGLFLAEGAARLW